LVVYIIYINDARSRKYKIMEYIYACPVKRTHDA